MSLTFVYQGKSKRYSCELSMRNAVSFFVLVSGVLLMSSRSAYSPNEDLARVTLTQNSLEEQKEDVVALKQTTEQQLGGLTDKLAELQVKLSQLEQLGQNIVTTAGLNPQEFSFASAQSQQIKADWSQEPLVSQIDQLAYVIDDKTRQLEALESILIGRHIDEESSLSGRPISSGWLSSYYGVRKDPFTGKPTMHKGLDFAGTEGEAVHSTGAGIVTWAGDRYGYGQLVEIDHGDGLTTRYGHNKKLNVKVGDVVTKGQNIALMGNTGRSTGAHVHYEVLRFGEQQDPLPFVYHQP